MNQGAIVAGTSEPRSFIGWLRLGWQAEIALFRQPMLVLSVLAIVVVPSLYAVFYISSFWDPYGHLDRLPAALVNADHGALVEGRAVNLGDEVVNSFEKQPPFHFIHLPDAAAADAALHRGEVYFTLVIPADFSERALAARKDEPATLSLQTAEGVSYTSAIISKRFGAELAHLLNERLNRERWAAVVGDPALTNDSLRVAIGELQDGSHRLQAGAQRLQAGSDRLDQGLGRVATGLQQMSDRLPDGVQLRELADGSKSAVAGESRLATGLDQMVAGGQRLEQGAGQLQQSAAGVPFWGGRLANGAAQIETGVATLDTNLSDAAAGSHELQTGLDKLNGGIQPLTAGLSQLETGLQEMRYQFSPATDPTNAAGEIQGNAESTNQSISLWEGSRQIVEGSKELAVGTVKMADSLDRLNADLTGKLGNADADGLAGSVQVKVESYAPVLNNGAAYCPYFTSLAVWLGGIMITFVFHCRRLIEPMKAAPRWIRWSAKSAVPLCLGVLQATVIVAVLRLAFGIVFVHPWLVWLVAALGAITFVSLVLLFVTVLGDAGRLVAVVLLILQLAAAGGIYPVELSGPFYAAIHPYLPLTALVNALRAAMFGAFEGSWCGPAMQLLITIGGAVVLGILFARWKYVSREAYGPAVEFN
jgi:putative membrane protein